MQRTHIYLPEELDRELEYIAKLQGTSKADVVRKALQVGIKVIQPKKSNSAQVLLDIAKEAEKLDISGPKDLSINHDYYTWGGPKRDPNAEV